MVHHNVENKLWSEKKKNLLMPADALIQPPSAAIIGTIIFVLMFIFLRINYHLRLLLYKTPWKFVGADAESLASLSFMSKTETYNLLAFDANLTACFTGMYSARIAIISSHLIDLVGILLAAAWVLLVCVPVPACAKAVTLMRINLATTICWVYETKCVTSINIGFWKWWRRRIFT